MEEGVSLKGGSVSVEGVRGVSLDGGVSVEGKRGRV